MTELTWVLVGFSIGGLIFSLIFRREKIKVVLGLLTVLWIVMFSIKFTVYLSIVTPPIPPELSIMGEVALILMILELALEVLTFQKERKQNK